MRPPQTRVPRLRGIAHTSSHRALQHRHLEMAFGRLIALSTLAAALTVSNAAVTKRVACADGVHTASNAACCAWYPILDDIQEVCTLTNSLFRHRIQ